MCLPPLPRCPPAGFHFPPIFMRYIQILWQWKRDVWAEFSIFFKIISHANFSCHFQDISIFINFSNLCKIVPPMFKKVRAVRPVMHHVPCHALLQPHKENTDYCLMHCVRQFTLSPKFGVQNFGTVRKTGSCAESVPFHEITLDWKPSIYFSILGLIERLYVKKT